MYFLDLRFDAANLEFLVSAIFLLVAMDKIVHAHMHTLKKHSFVFHMHTHTRYYLYVKCRGSAAEFVAIDANLCAKVPTDSTLMPNNSLIVLRIMLYSPSPSHLIFICMPLNTTAQAWTSSRPLVFPWWASQSTRASNPSSSTAQSPVSKHPPALG